MKMERDFTRRGHHDMGGLDAGPVQQTEHDYALWEKRVDALMVLLAERKLLSVDQPSKFLIAVVNDQLCRAANSVF